MGTKSRTDNVANGGTYSSSNSCVTPRNYRRSRFFKHVPINPNVFFVKIMEALDTSFLFAPICGMVISAVLAVIVLSVDSWMSDQNVHPPAIVATTTTASQNVLTTMATATISFAASAFSVCMLLIQLASSQYSPRVVNTLFRDPYNKKVIGLVIGAFTYSLVCLQSVSKKNLVPTVTTWVGIVLGLAAIVSVVFFIDHAAKTLDISRLLRHVSGKTIASVRKQWETCNVDEAGGDERTQEMRNKYQDLETMHVVRFRQRGWVQKIDHGALMKLVPKGGFLKIHTLEGRYALPGCAACSVSSEVCTGKDDVETAQHIFRDDHDMDGFDKRVLEAIAIGAARSNRNDPSFGLRQLVDVSCKALSPGINDPTTAQDAIFQAASVVIEYLQRRAPMRIFNPHDKDGGQLILEEQMNHDDIVRYAYDEVRSCAKSNPTVSIYLLESLALIRESLRAAGHVRLAPEIERQALLIQEGMDESNEIDEDKEMVREFRRKKFPDYAVEIQSRSKPEIDGVAPEKA